MDQPQVTEIKTVRDVDVSGKRALVRVDFNVPLDKAGNITDDTRIRAALPTIKYLIDHNARVILMSHLGRPDGKVVERLRLTPVAERLTQLLGKPVVKAPDCIGPQVEALVGGMRPGDVILLENLRFYPDEEKNDRGFAQKLANLGDIYVDDAFGTAHRAHASTAGVADFLPAVAGFLMEKEVTVMGRALEVPARLFVAIIGGAKISSKIGVITNLLDKVDYLLIGGGMANTFLKVEGYRIGKSLVEDQHLDLARDLMLRGDEKLVLPVDVVVADKLDATANYKTVDIEGVPDDWIIVDIGPRTVARFSDIISKAKTVVWNGPMGVFEISPFAQGTRAIAESLARSQAVTIVGGGESVAAVEQMGVADKITHVSTGGGATLEFLEGRVLPGVAVLQKKAGGSD
ncbi:MAG: phosphoglycerate kinase [Dehalococcoidales bacterium]|nr:phosphoglycerate kinase [Dehalococcoidales bacterium]